MQFLNPSNILVASGSRVNIVDIGVSDYASGQNGLMSFGTDNMYAPTSSPLVSGHTDMLREFAVGDGSIVASGGYDGSLIVTQVDQLGGGHNLGTFRTGGVIGSVKFHPARRVLSVLPRMKVSSCSGIQDRKMLLNTSQAGNSYTHSWDGDNTAIMDCKAIHPLIRKAKKRRKKRWEKRKKKKGVNWRQHSNMVSQTHIWMQS